jgi:hypothetical protein
MPGESAAVFGDALRRLSAAANYLYHDGARYWYSTQPTVTKMAEDPLGGDHAAPWVRPIPGAAMHPAAPPAPAGDRHGLPERGLRPALSARHGCFTP